MVLGTQQSTGVIFHNKQKMKCMHEIGISLMQTHGKKAYIAISEELMALFVLLNHKSVNPVNTKYRWLWHWITMHLILCQSY